MVGSIPFYGLSLFYASFENQDGPGGAQTPHFTAGAGGYLIYNQNNVISVNYGYSTDPQLGDHGLYVGAGVIF